MPARLQPKWKHELARRFDEAFEIVRGRDVRTRFLTPIQQGREPEPFAGSCPTKPSGRPTSPMPSNALSPSIDLVIADEAHRARNPAAQQSRVMRALAGCSDACLLLTATPVQTAIENLFQLLRLLEPDTFESLMCFPSSWRPTARSCEH